MYFNESNEDTNIDKEFKGKKSHSSTPESTKRLIRFAIIIIVIILIVILAILLLRNRVRYNITLTGGSNITVYQGMPYNEPGYVAYDNRQNNVSNNVQVEGTVDTNKVGTYTLTYRIQKESKARTINVIPGTEAVKTTISLISPIIMNLKVNQKFVEPGYEAIDPYADEPNITSKVERNPKDIDTSKKGTYQIVYSVVDSKGITVTETRTVIVE